MSDNKKITKKVDKIVMGAIIGGAIGSVLGITLAPKAGKETRKIIAEKTKSAYNKSKEAGGKFMVDHKDQIDSVKSTSKSIFGKIAWKIKSALSRSKTDARAKGGSIKQIPIEPLDIVRDGEEHEYRD